MEMIAEEDEEDELLAIASERCKPTSLEKMITLIATLVEKARGSDHTLKLTPLDHHIIAGGKVSASSEAHKQELYLEEPMDLRYHAEQINLRTLAMQEFSSNLP